MSGGWTNSTRAARLPKDWHKRRARTWRAAGGQCQWITDGVRCTWIGRLNGDNGQVDHINGPTDDDALQWLCWPHHQAKTAIESQAARPSRKRPKQPHPGLIPRTTGGG